MGFFTTAHQTTKTCDPIGHCPISQNKQNEHVDCVLNEGGKDESKIEWKITEDFFHSDSLDNDGYEERKISLNDPVNRDATISENTGAYNDRVFVFLCKKLEYPKQ